MPAVAAAVVAALYVALSGCSWRTAMVLILVVLAVLAWVIVEDENAREL